MTASDPARILAAIDIAPLVDAARESGGAEDDWGIRGVRGIRVQRARHEAAPFAPDGDLEARLAAIDEEMAGGTLRGGIDASVDMLRSVLGTRSFVPLPRAGVAGNVAALPGGAAFEHLLSVDRRTEVGGGRMRMFGLGSTGVRTSVRRLWRAVTRFLTELRSAVFGFRSTVDVLQPARLELACAFDGDMQLALHTPAAITLPPQRIADAMGVVRKDLGRFAASLYLVAKVADILATVVRAATNPISAVRALYGALRALYDLLAERLP